MCACKHKVSGSFHSPPGVLFTVPSQYWFSIGHQVVFRLGEWAPRLPCGFHVSAGTLDTGHLKLIFVYRTLTFSGVLSHTLRLTILRLIPVRTPKVFLPQVWPPPLSLATTRGISVDFFSSGYLDVSVPRVPFLYLWIQYRIYDSSS